MKIGLLADIHANAHALRVVLESAKKQGADKLLCCGDYVGYYYDPDSVMALLDNWDWVGISGNHEAMLYDWLNKKNREEIKAKYGSGISFASKKLDYETAIKETRDEEVDNINPSNISVSPSDTADGLDDLAIAALLHDTLEDTDTDIEEISKQTAIVAKENELQDIQIKEIKKKSNNPLAK